jgi:ATP-binding cassette, subfamily B, bacterial PglK
MGPHVFSIISTALRLIPPGGRKRWLLLMVVALVVSLLELVGAMLVFLLLALVADPGGEIVLPLLGDLRQFGGINDDTMMLALAAGMAAFFVVRPAIHIFKVYAESRIAYNFGARLSADLARGYLTLPYSFHLRRNSSTLIRNSYQAVDETVGQIFLPVIRIVTEAIMVLSMLLLLIVLAPLATALAVLLLGGAALVLALLIQPRLKRLGKQAHLLHQSTLRLLQQSLQGIRDIKILGREHTFASEYEQGRFALSRTKYLRGTAAVLPRDVLETALILFILTFFAVGVVRDQGSESLLSVLGLFAYAGLRLQPALQTIVSGLNNLKFASAPLDDVAADLDLIRRSKRVSKREEDPLRLTSRWEASGITFSYEKSDRPALSDVDLSIGVGEVVGICGPTGGGKTTLVDVLTGLLEPSSGRVTVDGLDLRQHARSWHRNLGVVPQMIFLTDDTLRKNIALGAPDAEIDDDAVQEAVGMAQLEAFVASLPDGLETEVGERGVRVSGGQRQRVAIARALYRRPQVLIFDEGTSALDNRTEAELMQALERLRGDHTIVMVAHRLSTVRNCDRIAFVDHGRIAGIGSYDELTATSEGFRRLTASM